MAAGAGEQDASADTAALCGPPDAGSPVGRAARWATEQSLYDLLLAAVPLMHAIA